MASSLRRMGSHSHRFVFPQLINRRLSTGALSSVEFKRGDEHLQRRIMKHQSPLLKLNTRKEVVTRIISHSRNFCTTPQTQKLERIADEILSLTKLERNDYTVLLRYKLGFDKYGPKITGIGSSSYARAPTSAGTGSGVKAAAKVAEKVVFDVKIEKYDASSKIKIIKEVRGFTELGLKEAKDLVEKVPVVVKKGISKQDAESIMAKLKDLGATVVLE